MLFHLPGTNYWPYWKPLCSLYSFLNFAMVYSKFSPATYFFLSHLTSWVYWNATLFRSTIVSKSQTQQIFVDACVVSEATKHIKLLPVLSFCSLHHPAPGGLITFHFFQGLHFHHSFSPTSRLSSRISYWPSEL